ncbi:MULTISPECIES: RNA polymerase sigma factor [Chitinophagaceae]|uniref:RNA polymerase sigma factor n=1 Tax=Niabella digestorum TaxID=3117701 RepID=A0ABU7RFX7_9BACT
MLSESPPIYQRESVKTSQLNKSDNKLAQSGEALLDILKGCQNNIEHHKETLYKSFYGYVKGVVTRYVTDFHYAEEIVNDSFIKIFNNLSSFQALGQATNVSTSFKAWIAKIASRTAIDFLRKKKIDFNKDDISDINHSSIAYEQSSSSEIKDILKLLNALPQTQRAIFNLYEIEGFSHQEIAVMLSIPENVSRSYLSRAKNKLKALYIENF